MPAKARDAITVGFMNSLLDHHNSINSSNTLIRVGLNLIWPVGDRA